MRAPRPRLGCHRRPAPCCAAHSPTGGAPSPHPPRTRHLLTPHPSSANPDFPLSPSHPLSLDLLSPLLNPREHPPDAPWAPTSGAVIIIDDEELDEIAICASRCSAAPNPSRPISPRQISPRQISPRQIAPRQMHARSPASATSARSRPESATSARSRLARVVPSGAASTRASATPACASCPSTPRPTFSRRHAQIGRWCSTLCHSRVRSSCGASGRGKPISGCPTPSASQPPTQRRAKRWTRPSTPLLGAADGAVNGADDASTLDAFKPRASSLRLPRSSPPTTAILWSVSSAHFFIVSSSGMPHAIAVRANGRLAAVPDSAVGAAEWPKQLDHAVAAALSMCDHATLLALTLLPTACATAPRCLLLHLSNTPLPPPAAAGVTLAPSSPLAGSPSPLAAPWAPRSTRPATAARLLLQSRRGRAPCASGSATRSRAAVSPTWAASLARCVCIKGLGGGADSDPKSTPYLWPGARPSRGLGGRAHSNPDLKPSPFARCVSIKGLSGRAARTRARRCSRELARRSRRAREIVRRRAAGREPSGEPRAKRIAGSREARAERLV